MLGMCCTLNSIVGLSINFHTHEIYCRLPILCKYFMLMSFYYTLKNLWDYCYGLFKNICPIFLCLSLHSFIFFFVLLFENTLVLLFNFFTLPSLSQTFYSLIKQFAFSLFLFSIPPYFF